MGDAADRDGHSLNRGEPAHFLRSPVSTRRRTISFPCTRSALIRVGPLVRALIPDPAAIRTGRAMSMPRLDSRSPDHVAGSERRRTLGLRHTVLTSPSSDPGAVSKPFYRDRARTTVSRFARASGGQDGEFKSLRGKAVVLPQAANECGNMLIGHCGVVTAREF